MVKRTLRNPKRGTPLWRIGAWATVWWGVSGAYVLLLVWVAKDYYVERAAGSTSSSLGNWWHAIGDAYTQSVVLPGLLALIGLVWLVGGLVWLRELKRRRISYAAAFKDLFLTIY